MRIKLRMLLPLGLLSMAVAVPLGASTATAEHQQLSDAPLIHSGLVQTYKQCGAALPQGAGTPDTTRDATAPFPGVPACRHDAPTAGQNAGPNAFEARDGTTSKSDPIAQGEVTILVRTNDPSTVADDTDVVLEAIKKDVQCAHPGAASCQHGAVADPIDYNPSATGQDGTVLATIRITDANCNGQVGPHCTTVDLPFTVPLFCNDTPTQTTIGSTCHVQTTANAVLGGLGQPAITEGHHGNVMVFRITVRDNGPDGVSQLGNPDDTLWEQQGIWIP